MKFHGIFSLMYFISTLVVAQNNLELDKFVLGEQVSIYPSFKVADSIPKGTEFRNPKFQYYLHDNAKSYLFLDRPIGFAIATTNLSGQILSISFVIKFDDKLLMDLQQRYGRWDTASRGAASENYDSLDTSKFSYYIWKKEDGSIDLSINRYKTQFGSGIDKKDYAIISRRSKDYWDLK